MKKTLRNLFIVWILTSLWHGVSINFILWGMILCLVIMIEKVVSYYWNQKKDGAKSETVDLKNNTTENTETEQKTKKLNLNLIIKKTLQHIYVLFIIVLTWTCFAVTDFQDLSTYLGRMFGILSGVRVNETIFMTLLGKYGFTILIGILLCTNKAHQCYKEWKDGYLGMITLAILFWVSVWYIHMMGDNPFLYFRF